MVAALAVAHNVQTSYTKQAVCMGDSTVEGYGVSGIKSWPVVLSDLCPEVAVFNYGVGSRKISTNGATGNVMWGKDTTKVDPVFKTGYRNWELIQAGINDITADSLSGQATYERMTNYVGQRLAAKAWEIAVNTITSAGTANVTNYNAALRGQAQPWARLNDFGHGSRVADPRLATLTDTNYYFDTTHHNAGGHAVVAERAVEIINAHRRGSFFQ